MSGSVASTIMGEAGSNPANQFAVATTIYNRAQAGTFPGGSDPNQIVNAPNQYTGNATPNASALMFADAIQNGTLQNYGTVGNAVNFQASGSATTLGSNPNAVNIGGNNFSDNFGSPTSNFVPPAYGQNPGLAGLGNPNLTQLNDPAYLTGMPTYGDQTASDTTGLPYGGTGAEMAGVYGTTANGLQQEGYYGGSLHVNVTPTNTAAAVGSGSAPGSIANTGVLGGLFGGTSGTGTGTPVNVGLQSSLVSDIGKWIQAPITAAEQGLSATLASMENWLGRGMLILIAIVILFIALWRVSGSPKPQFIMPVPA